MNVMVMDVEGTDGRERGEDQVSPLVSNKQTWSHHISRTLRENRLYSL